MGEGSKSAEWTGVWHPSAGLIKDQMGCPVLDLLLGSYWADWKGIIEMEAACTSSCVANLVRFGLLFFCCCKVQIRTSWKPKQRGQWRIPDHPRRHPGSSIQPLWLAANSFLIAVFSVLNSKFHIKKKKKNLIFSMVNYMLGDVIFVHQAGSLQKIPSWSSSVVVLEGLVSHSNE